MGARSLLLLLLLDFLRDKQKNNLAVTSHTRTHGYFRLNEIEGGREGGRSFLLSDILLFTPPSTKRIKSSLIMPLDLAKKAIRHNNYYAEKRSRERRQWVTSLLHNLVSLSLTHSSPDFESGQLLVLMLDFKISPCFSVPHLFFFSLVKLITDGYNGWGIYLQRGDKSVFSFFGPEIEEQFVM